MMFNKKIRDLIKQTRKKIKTDFSINLQYRNIVYDVNQKYFDYYVKYVVRLM